MLANAKWNAIEDLVSNTLISSFIIHDEFAFVKNLRREHDYMKKQ